MDAAIHCVRNSTRTVRREAVVTRKRLR